MSIESLRKWSGKDICDPPDFYNRKTEELEIPAFMLRENQYRQKGREWRSHNEQARIGAAVGAVKREHRQAHRAEQNKKAHTVEFIVFAAAITSLFLLVGAVEMGLIL